MSEIDTHTCIHTHTYTHTHTNSTRLLALATGDFVSVGVDLGRVEVVPLAALVKRDRGAGLDRRVLQAPGATHTVTAVAVGTHFVALLCVLLCTARVAGKASRHAGRQAGVERRASFLHAKVSYGAARE